MISWEEIEKHLPDEYDEERHEVLRHEIKWYEHKIRDLEDEIEDLEEQLEPYKLDMETLEAQINDIQNKINDEVEKIETKYDELINEKLEQIEKLKLEIDELSKCREGRMRMPDKCKWIYDEYHDYWDTECGEGQIFTADGPKENKYKYCPYCGKEIGVSEDD